MTLQVARLCTGILLLVSGALMYAASWQRWSGSCGWGDEQSPRCLDRQDHLYDFIAPSAPWEPVGGAAQLAGGSMLVLAVALALMPWALTGRRPGLLHAVALAVPVVATAVVGGVTLRSGLTGSVVETAAYAVAIPLWLFVVPLVVVAWTVMSRSWALAAAGAALFLATPLVAAFSYAVGPFDAQPWWEGVSGALTALAGLCLLASARPVPRGEQREPGRRAARVGDGRDRL